MKKFHNFQTKLTTLIKNQRFDMNNKDILFHCNEEQNMGYKQRLKNLFKSIHY